MIYEHPNRKTDASLLTHIGHHLNLHEGGVLHSLTHLSVVAKDLVVPFRPTLVSCATLRTQL